MLLSLLMMRQAFITRLYQEVQLVFRNQLHSPTIPAKELSLLLVSRPTVIPFTVSSSAKATQVSSCLATEHITSVRPSMVLYPFRISFTSIIALETKVMVRWSPSLNGTRGC